VRLARVLQYREMVMQPGKASVAMPIADQRSVERDFNLANRVLKSFCKDEATSLSSKATDRTIELIGDAARFTEQKRKIRPKALGAFDSTTIHAVLSVQLAVSPSERVIERLKTRHRFALQNPPALCIL
jgi:hypothetical protein